jgi:hypothetical protein
MSDTKRFNPFRVSADEETSAKRAKRRITDMGLTFTCFCLLLFALSGCSSRKIDSEQAQYIDVGHQFLSIQEYEFSDEMEYLAITYKAQEDDNPESRYGTAVFDAPLRFMVVDIENEESVLEFTTEGRNPILYEPTNISWLSSLNSFFYSPHLRPFLVQVDTRNGEMVQYDFNHAGFTTNGEDTIVAWGKLVENPSGSPPFKLTYSEELHYYNIVNGGLELIRTVNIGVNPSRILWGGGDVMIVEVTRASYKRVTFLLEESGEMQPYEPPGTMTNSSLMAQWPLLVAEEGSINISNYELPCIITSYANNQRIGSQLVQLRSPEWLDPVRMTAITVQSQERAERLVVFAIDLPEIDSCQ